MKKIFISVALLFVLAASIYAWNPLVIGGGSAAGGGETPLYTAALAVWDFEGDVTDTKGSYDLSCTNCPDYPSEEAQSCIVGSQSGDFNGTNDVATGSESAFEFGNTEDFAVCYWMYPDLGQDGDVVSDYDHGNGNGWILTASWVTSSYDQVARIADDWNTADLEPGLTLSNRWYHVCFSFDADGGVAGEGTFWISDTTTHGADIDGTAYASSYDSDVNSDDFRVGWGEWYGYFNGHIDELVIWDRTISAAEAESVWDCSWRGN